jgi:hypothetical protein
VTPGDTSLITGEVRPPPVHSMAYDISEGSLLYGGDHVNVVFDPVVVWLKLPGYANFVGTGSPELKDASKVVPDES